MGMSNAMMQAAQLFSGLTGVQERFATAWMAAENGYTWDNVTNNPANISWSGKGIPSGGVFKGVVKVLPNEVCVYVDWQAGVRAWALELNIPKSQTKWLTIDTRDLLSCTSIENMSRVVGQSNWAGAHYVGRYNTWQGGSIYEAYISTVLDSWYGKGGTKMIVPAPVITPHPVQAPVPAVPMDWKAAAVALLKSDGLITSDHKPDETFTFADMGVVWRRMKEQYTIERK
jgi:hypothetical protein